MFHPQGDTYSWNLHHNRDPYDWEREESYFLLLKPQQVKPRVDNEDPWQWKDGKTDFNVKSAYEIMEEEFAHQYQIRIRDFPSTKVSIRSTPSNINFFIWAPLQGRTLTSDNFRKRKKILFNRCPLWQNDEETIQHLFMSCPFLTESGMCWQLEW